MILISLSIVFFTVVICVRTFFEVSLSSFFFSHGILMHAYCWFSFVFLWFLNVAKHITGLSTKRIPYLVFLSPIVLIPVVSSFIKGEQLNLQYLGIRNSEFIESIKHIVTLNYYHSNNHEQFYELLILVILLVAGSYYISRSVKKTVLATVVAYFGSFFIAGLKWFGINVTGTSYFFSVTTVIEDDQAIALIYFSLSVIAFLILALPEFKTTFSRMFSEKSFVFSISLFFIWTIIFTMTFKRPTGREISAFDVVFTFIPLFVMLQYVLTLRTQTPNQRILFGWTAVVGGFVLFPMLFGVY